MAAKTKAVGGGPATGLADNWISALQQLLNHGGLGPAGSPNAGGSTGDIMSVLSDILSAGGGKAGNAISDMISKQQTRDVNALRSRFGAGGGVAFGTPAAYSESLYRAEAAPQITNAITGLQLQTIMPLLSAITGLSGKGIAQRQIVQEKSGLAQGLGLLTGIAGAAAPFFLPGIGGAGRGATAGFPGNATQGVDSGYVPPDLG